MMAIFNRVVVAVVWMGVVGVLGDAAPEPQITPGPLLVRQEPAQMLIGYYSESGFWYPQECRTGFTWTASSIYGRCCTTGNSPCRFITACDGPTAVFADGARSTCSGSTYTVCNTDYIVSTLNDAYPTGWIGCASSGKQTVYVRTTPGATSGTSTTKPTTSTSSTPTSTSSSSTTPPISSTTTPAASSSTSEPVPAPKKNQGWIAGAVIGPVAAFAIAGILIWAFFLRKRKAKKEEPLPPHEFVQQSYPPTGPPGPQMMQPQNVYMQPGQQQDPRFSVAPPYSGGGYYPQGQQPMGWSQGSPMMGDPKMAQGISPVQEHYAMGDGKDHSMMSQGVPSPNPSSASPEPPRPHYELH